MIPGYRSPHLPQRSATVVGWLTDPQRDPIARTTAGWNADDWEAARWAIQVHGIGPLLHQASERWLDAGALHPHLQGYLAAQRRLSRERVALLLGDLAEIARACKDRGIDVLPLKGSQLATQYYAEPGLRPMSDLDLLVRPADERRMLALLTDLGYRQTGRGWKHITLARPEADGPVVSYDGEHPDNPRSIDLHIRLAEQFWGIQYDLTAEAWADSEPWAAARRLRPAGLLHHLAVHASSDAIARRLRLLHLHDIALVARDVDRSGWERIVASARSRREERMVYPALLLASRSYPAMPGWALAALRGGVPSDLLRYLDATQLDQLSFCNQAPTRPADKLRWFRPGHERIGALRHMLLPDPSELGHWYPRLARPGRLPLAYACYGATLLGWGVRRALGQPRLTLGGRARQARG
ncbi:MAG TPA: nucleotidyltransferase family protein [Roseiflexaceae bacterium]